MRVYTRIMKTECYCIALRSAARRVSAMYDEEFADMGISIAQFSLLRRLDRTGAVSITALGALTDLDRSTVGRNVKVLARLGLVEACDAEDAREAIVAVSDRGKAAVKAGATAWKRAQRRVERALGDDGPAQLRALLQALSAPA